MGVSIRAFAKLVGVTEAAIRKGIRSGRVVLSADGTLDPKTQVARWNDTRDPSKIRAHNAPRMETATETRVTFQKLRAAKLGLEIEIAREELRCIQSASVSIGDVNRAVESYRRLVVDLFGSFADRYGEQIAASLGCNQQPLIDSIRRHVGTVLTEISEIRPTLP